MITNKSTWLMAAVFVMLVSCSMAAQKPDSLWDSLSAAYRTISVMNDAAALALDNGKITIEQACTVSELSKPILAALDAAAVELSAGHAASASEQIQIAQEALDAMQDEAYNRIAYSCRRGSEN